MLPMSPRWAGKGFVEQPPRAPRCQVTSLPLPGTHERPQASCQLTLLCPGAIVTCERKKCPHERHQDQRGHLHRGGEARTSDPSIPPCHPCDASPHEQEQLADGFWFLTVCLQGLSAGREAGVPPGQGRGGTVPPALGVNERPSEQFLSSGARHPH